MSIAADEDRLFAEWSAGRSSFIRDGVIDEKGFKSAGVRVAFILKEPNSKERFGDLREYFRQPEFASTSNNLARWAFGMSHLDQEIPWRDISTVTYEARKEWLGSTCIVNVKKSAGGSASDYPAVLSAMQQDRPYILRQMSIYRPFLELVVCCGRPTDQINIVDSPLWKRTSKGLRFYELESGGHVLAFYHPQARYPTNLLFYGLVDSAREILRSSGARRGRG